MDSLRGKRGIGYNTINTFREKEESEVSIINAGFMVLEPKNFEYIEGDNIVFEKVPLVTIANLGE